MPPPPPPTSGKRSRWLLRVLSPLCVALLLTGYFLLPQDQFGPHHPGLSWSVFGVALAALSWLLLIEIRRMLVRPKADRTAVGIMLLVVLSLVIFSSAYLALAHSPGEFKGLHTRLDALYFTVITVSTVGYGDVAPSGQTARAIVIVQIGYNFVFLTAAASAITTQMRGRVVERVHQRSQGREQGREQGHERGRERGHGGHEQGHERGRSQGRKRRR
jgi:voltage-gated potassium channel